MHLEDILNTFENLESFSSIQLQKTLRDIVHVSGNIPHPAHGYTYQRWQTFAQIAGTNLTLAKWFESHCDALSILNELNIRNIPQGVWAVWAAEGSQNPLRCNYDPQNHCTNDLALKDKNIIQQGHGEKLWCSGADFVDYGLMTFKDLNNKSLLGVVNMHHTGIEIDHSHWHAVGMGATQTARLNFNNVPMNVVGQPDEYLTRLGFWHGAAGVAACWFGATVRIAAALKALFKNKATPYNAMYLGDVSSQLVITKQLFKSLADKIDQKPYLTHELEIRILRVHVEKVSKSVIELVGNAMGARPFCEDAIFAQLVADLPVFLRQSHAAHDLAKIAELSSNTAKDHVQHKDQEELSLWML